MKTASIITILALACATTICMTDTHTKIQSNIFVEYIPASQNTTATDKNTTSVLLDKIDSYVKNEKTSQQYLDLILENSQATGVDPELIARVIAKESSFRPNVTSPVGARGLMQVMPNWKLKSNGQVVWTRRKNTNVDLYHPKTNIAMGTKILAHYIARYDSVERALAAYNGSKGSTKYSNAVLAIF